MTDRYLGRTELLNFDARPIRDLILARGWADMPPFARIGAAYDFVREEIAFGYNSDDAIPASKVMRDGHGQCNTKATLLMALLRALDIPCRLHGFTIHKALQRGVVPEFAYRLAPKQILHSWVEVDLGGDWVTLEGFILDTPFLAALQSEFPRRSSLCAYGVGTDCLADPPVSWIGKDTYIQRSGIDRDLGLYLDPDTFYASHRQALGFARRLLYRYGVRHWMNARVAGIRRGRVPTIPGGPETAWQADSERRLETR